MARYKFNLKLVGAGVDDALRQRIVDAHTTVVSPQFDSSGVRLQGDLAAEFQRVLDYYEDLLIAALARVELDLGLEQERLRRKKAFEDSLKQAGTQT